MSCAGDTGEGVTFLVIEAACRDVARAKVHIDCYHLGSVGNTTEVVVHHDQVPQKRGEVLEVMRTPSLPTYFVRDGIVLGRIWRRAAPRSIISIRPFMSRNSLSLPICRPQNHEQSTRQGSF